MSHQTGLRQHGNLEVLRLGLPPKIRPDRQDFTLTLRIPSNLMRMLQQPKPWPIKDELGQRRKGWNS